MATFPAGTYAPRTVENKTGIVYDAAKTKILFAEDINKANDEIVALQTFTRLPGAAPASPVAGSAYFDTATNKLYVYTGAAWKFATLA